MIIIHYIYICMYIISLHEKTFHDIVPLSTHIVHICPLMFDEHAHLIAGGNPSCTSSCNTQFTDLQYQLCCDTKNYGKVYM